MVRPFLTAELEGRRGAIMAALLLLLLLPAFFLPAFVNRQPVMYSDSVGYFHSGYSAVKETYALVAAYRGGAMEARAKTMTLDSQKHDGISTARSVYYGLAYVAAYWLGGVWAFALAHVLLAMTALLLAAWRVVGLRSLAGWTLVFAIVLFTGLNFFSVTAMPDLFAGLMLLGFAMTLAYGRAMHGLEYGFWLILILGACLFHKAHLAILAVALAVAAPFLWRRRAKAILILCAIVPVALLGHWAVDAAVVRLTGQPPIAPPFLLARLVGDGTAERYLAGVCPTRHFATCAYLGRMPMSADDFLWSHDPEKSVMGTAPLQTRRAIADEAGEIVRGTFVSYPLAEFKAEAGNVLTLFLTPGVNEFALVPKDDVAPIPVLAWALDHYANTAIAKGRMPLGAITLLMRAVYFLSLAAVAGLLWRERPTEPLRNFVLLLLLGIAANALVSGAVSGIADRYQGRVAWLAALALAGLLAARLRTSSRAATL